MFALCATAVAIQVKNLISIFLPVHLLQPYIWKTFATQFQCDSAVTVSLAAKVPAMLFILLLHVPDM